MQRFDFNESFEKMMEENGLDTVVLLGHMNPDGDAAGSVLGLAHYISVVYPQYRAVPYLAQTLARGAKKQVAEDTVFTPFDYPEAERYGVIVCDTATKARMIGLELYEKAISSIVIDHHAANDGYGDVKYVKISEACAENIYYMLDWSLWSEDVHPNAADYIYMGILQDTGGFARGTASTFLAANGLLELGVSHRYVMNTMFDNTFDDLRKQADILLMAERAIDGKAAYVYVDRETAEAKKIGYDDIHPVSAILRDCDDIELGFTMYEEAPNVWRCSFRSDGITIDVNKLAGLFGGGGHAGAAGLRKMTDEPEGLLSSILERASGILLREE